MKMDKPGIDSDSPKQFEVNMYAIVRVISQPIGADNVIQAVQKFNNVVPLELLLRNITSGRYVKKIEYSGEISHCSVTSVEPDPDAGTLFVDGEELSRLLKEIKGR
jgi:phosphoribosylaminoimidazole-succinocarboxamide synthase